MKFIKKKTDELKYANYNPRKKLKPEDKEYQKIKNSIEEFGYVEPIIINNDNTIIGGHQRLTVLKDLGYKEVDVIQIDIDKTKEKALNIALNKITGEWDYSLLGDLLLDLDSLNYDLEITGFDLDEIENIMAPIEEEQEIVEDDFDIEPPEEPKAKLGDIYQLGNHRLMCGSALKMEDIEKLLNNNKCELTFTDPPYQLETQGGGILKIANSMKQIKENGVDNFDPQQLILVSNTNIYCHNKPLIKKYIELAEKNNMAYDLCFYKKTNTVPNYKGHMMTDCEYIAIIGNQDPNKGLEKEEYSKCYIGQKDSDNELSYSKPVGLCAKYIKLYSQKNVLDLFGGSGSTLIACEQLNRNCYMMELDPKYVDVIIKRWEELTGKKAIKVAGE